MHYNLVITNRAKKDILNLPTLEAKRITKKLRFFISDVERTKCESSLSHFRAEELNRLIPRGYCHAFVRAERV